LKALYVGTSEIYGTGVLYRLDLVNRTFQPLVPKSEWRFDPKPGHSTTITGVDLTTGEVTVELSIWDEASKRTKVQKLKVK
jgi:hypothetical protein